ncbi:MAG: cation diffusion facilitator family transporter [candidate division WOR-3 bacterium]|nr:cation diffusion facilitator family transporter [candidate division WOR-3 bacterium]
MSAHDHDHSHARQGRSLVVSILLNLGFAVAELVFGLMANSLTLVANSIHDASDAVALTLSYFGFRLSERAPNSRRTFGYRKVRILTAFLNAGVLVALSVLVIRSAILRIVKPEPVQSPTLIFIAVVGLVVNGVAVLLLRRDRESLVIRAAMWHLLDDFLGFIAVLVGGVVIRLTGWYVIDPILSIMVSGMVIWGAWSVFRDSASILIDSTPHDVSFDTVRKFIVDFAPEITGVHDLHIWTIGEGERALMAHLKVRDSQVSSFQPMLSKLESALRDNFGLNHVTLELEGDVCKSGDNVCLG